MTDTHVLFRRATDAVGAKKLAMALSRDLSHVYKMGRDPHDTGEANLFDWTESLAEVLAANPDARAVLREIQLWHESLFARVLDRYTGRAVDDEELRKCAVSALREAADVVEEACDGDADDDALIVQCLEAREAIDRIVKAAEARITNRKVTDIRRRTA